MSLTNENQDITHCPENNDSKDEEDDTYQLQPLV